MAMPVIITAEVADALEILTSASEVLSAIFENPAQLILRLEILEQICS
jgi:uncharacterized iron-regulated protein